MAHVMCHSKTCLQFVLGGNCGDIAKFLSGGVILLAGQRQNCCCKVVAEPTISEFSQTPLPFQLIERHTNISRQVETNQTRRNELRVPK
jgi:hypothetical protein